MPSPRRPAGGGPRNSVSRPLDIAMVAHFAYGAIAGGRSGHVGGVERQTSLMSRWLAARGHRVSLLTWDEGQGDEVVIDGVRVISICRQDAGLPGVRFVTPRWTGLINALNRADAQLCYHNCAEYVTGQVAMWSRQRGRPFVFSVASDVDVHPDLPELSKLRERWLYRYGLRHANRIIVQTDAQRESLKSAFGRNGDVLPMPCPGPAAIEYRQPDPPRGDTGVVLWAGRIASVKRLELLLEVARALPSVRFDVAGMPYEGDPYSQAVMAEAHAVANVNLLGTVPREEMPTRYRSASLLCCTSLYEGFPNTFIEAWSHGIPVISTVDPDRLLTRLGLGAAGSTAGEIAAAIRSFMKDGNRWMEASQKARAYYAANHAVDAAMSKFEGLFQRAHEEHGS